MEWVCLCLAVVCAGDGVTELAVGADGFPSGEFYGTVYILFMRADGTVRCTRRHHRPT